jgi:N-methylhydantoinase A
MVHVAIDTGGTYTDVVAVDAAGRVATAKVRSTPEDPSRAASEGLRRVVDELGGGPVELVHGTTVATNALLTQRGAEVAFVTDAGFEDLLAIGRQARPSLYALQPRQRDRIVPRERCLGIEGRRTHDGTRLTPLDLDELRSAVRALPPGPLSWAICRLHAWRDPADEQAVAAVIRELRPGDAVSVSAEILPVFREVERASTTVANAFVAPLMSRYLTRLASVAERIDIMASSGGRISVDEARRRPVLTALSGPAGGVVAARAVAAALGVGGVLSFDMGGTSTDVALCGAELPIRHGASVGNFEIHVGMLDIHTIGAGGGSIASIGLGGRLRVGPESAGADPGPACFGTGELPTVTDANVVLGRLPSDVLLGGTDAIDPARSFAAVGSLAAEVGASTEQTARGIIQIAVEAMARAVRRVSSRRGIDPRDLPLCGLGGAAGLHACELAESLGMRTVVLPPRAGLLSAVGLLRGAPVAERSRTVLGLDDAAVELARAELIAEATAALGVPPVVVAPRIEIRAVGQSHALTVPFEAAVDEARAAFAGAHEREFGFVAHGAVEAVTVRVRVEGASLVLWDEVAPETLPFASGPCAWSDADSTTWVAPGWHARRWGSGVILERAS